MSVELGLSVICAAAFGAVAALMSANRISGFDRRLINSLQGMESSQWTAAMKALGSLASGIPVAVIIAAVLLVFLVTKRFRQAVLFFTVLAGSQAMNMALKAGFQRERPDIHRIIEETGYSFPSGTAMSAFALFAVMTFLLWRAIPSRIGRGLLLALCVLLIASVGASRVYLGVHYPSDIIAGYLASGLWLAICMYAYNRSSARKAHDAGKGIVA
ncbi:phosphatase PAP2 family protein [Paenibacillus sp. NEAU-GSW1]|uniref:phosphatase PAP2 family protein n=1 Tax=Paenibacillus sp. NEAU-GSW1 TaxID=2682486 RepID=UPI001C12AFF2|nr:phosphatase PAP2 family protein [Paenibacillus sp. NEAU-GSW1]